MGLTGLKPRAGLLLSALEEILFPCLFQPPEPLAVLGFVQLPPSPKSAAEGQVLRSHRSDLCLCLPLPLL